MGNKDFSDFLLTEYENIAAAFFNSREVLAKWVKYYLVVMAAPFSFIAFIYKERPDNFNIFALPATLAILISLIGVIGLLLSFVIIESGIDSVLYARTVNGVRKYFVDRSGVTNKREYVVLPTDIKKPAYIGFGDLAWITIITGMINSFYVSLAIPQVQIVRQLYINYINQTSLSITIFTTLLIAHPVYYAIAARSKDKKYGRH